MSRGKALEPKQPIKKNIKEDPDINEEKREEILNVVEEVEEKREENSSFTERSSSSKTSVLTDILSPWRAAAKLHVKNCRAKYILEFGKDIHLHSDDSDTMIRLKEKITPINAKVIERQRLQKEHKKLSKSIPTAFDEWLNKKNRELKLKKLKINKQQQTKQEKEVADVKEAKKKNRNWKNYREYLENEKRALEKIKERVTSGKCNLNDIKPNKMNNISAMDWEKIRQAAEDNQHTEPLKLGRLEGQGNVDPGKYLTKYIVKPDPAFRARYKHILEAATARPTEIILDGDHKDTLEDPAELPRQFLHSLREEAKRLKVLKTKKEKHCVETKK